MSMEKKPIKSFKYTNPLDLKVGDDVFLGEMSLKEWKGEGCPLCHQPTQEEIDSGDLVSYDEEQVCESHRIATLIQMIGSQKMLRIEQWKDEHKHWRAGIEWYGENNYEFIVEKPTLLEC